MKLGYEVRSRYVHGAVARKLAESEKANLLENLCEYARIGCLFWLQLTGLRHHRRETLLRTINLALVDDGARKELEQWCSAIQFGRKDEVSSQ